MPLVWSSIAVDSLGTKCWSVKIPTNHECSTESGILVIVVPNSPCWDKVICLGDEVHWPQISPPWINIHEEKPCWVWWGCSRLLQNHTKVQLHRPQGCRFSFLHPNLDISECLASFRKNHRMWNTKLIGNTTAWETRWAGGVCWILSSLSALKCWGGDSLKTRRKAKQITSNKHNSIEKYSAPNQFSRY